MDILELRERAKTFRTRFTKAKMGNNVKCSETVKADLDTVDYVAARLEGGDFPLDIIAGIMDFGETSINRIERRRSVVEVDHA